MAIGNPMAQAESATFKLSQTASISAALKPKSIIMAQV
jgi:hypothetical protein